MGAKLELFTNNRNNWNIVSDSNKLLVHVVNIQTLLSLTKYSVNSDKDCNNFRMFWQNKLSNFLYSKNYHTIPILGLIKGYFKFLKI